MMKSAKSVQSGSNAAPVLESRALNRALLARQLLLSRAKLSALEAIEHLLGLQAQSPYAPYFGLWTRLDCFRHEELSELILSKRAVRLALMRSTLHLVSASDGLSLRPWLQPALERGLSGAYGKRTAGLDLDAVAAAGRALTEEQPLTFDELGKRLGERWPEREPAALEYTVRTYVPLVQVPPRGIWGAGGQAMHTPIETWLGRPLASDIDSGKFLLRYLAAFGPAGVKDMQIWSGHTGLREAVERLRPQLLVFHDENGNELFDLEDAPRPDADMLAPVRFIAEYDNLLLSHADRTRIIADKYRTRVLTKNGIVRSTVLVDGFVRGIWSIERKKREPATLVIEAFEPISHEDQIALTDEGEQLLRFAAADAGSYDIRFVFEQ
ncbi:winged helix DNA-binding domain-containing protein [Paenibacillus hamazuiensis]|uniref:winged helix DNA-binding domain-containing protein n=1 Tax=Paenibacillus hamazuiensis TaxID=2936508 RepID=UPI00200C3461|nr:winged helix DNA-binding domain-containing protein [Paenibacillus hamazuiensis]